MTDSNAPEAAGSAEADPAADLIAARRQKLRFLREELKVEPYGSPGWRDSPRSPRPGKRSTRLPMRPSMPTPNRMINALAYWYPAE